VNWVTKTFRRMTRKRALERWETKRENCEVTPQAIWPTAKSLTKRGRPKAPIAPLGSAFYPIEKANVIANCLENLFTPHELCDTDHEPRVKAQVQALLTVADGNPSVKFRPCDFSKEIRSLKLGKVCGIPRRFLVHITHLFNHCLRLCHFPASWKEAKITSLPKPGKNPKFSQNLRPISLLSTTGKLFKKLILTVIHRHIKERNLLNASQFGFVRVTARHSNV
jgi:hypothetical protein